MSKKECCNCKTNHESYQYIEHTDEESGLTTFYCEYCLLAIANIVGEQHKLTWDKASDLIDYLETANNDDFEESFTEKLNTFLQEPWDLRLKENERGEVVFLEDLLDRGIKAGDILVEIDGSPMETLDFDKFDMIISRKSKINAKIKRTLENKEVKKNIVKKLHRFKKEITDIEENGLVDPNKMMSILDTKVIGQEDAKKKLIVAIMNHIAKEKKPSIDKTNVLIVGPSGTGKTELAETIAALVKQHDIPFVITTTAGMSQSGYVGNDPSYVLEQLILSAGEDIKKAERGIIFLDEIDKITHQGGGDNRDITGDSVQDELLSIIQGTSSGYTFTAGRGTESKTRTINTQGILFICAGAFKGLEGIVNKRKNKKKIGLSSSNKDRKEFNYLSHFDKEDLIQYGLKPEFIGRLPIVTHTDYLDKDILRKILCDKDNSLLKQKKDLFKQYKVDVDFDESFIKQIVELTAKSETGARELPTILASLLTDFTFNLPSYENKKIKIKKDGEIQELSEECFKKGTNQIVK